MARTLTINNREFSSAGDAGKHFGYTRDYMLTLARDGKIEGKKIGHRWYINLESAESFFESAKVLRAERRKEISVERKVELKKHEYSRKATIQKQSGLVEVLGIFLVVLVIGLTGYVGNVGLKNQALFTETGSDFSFFKEFARSLYELVSPQSEATISTIVDEVPPSSTSTSNKEEVTDMSHFGELSKETHTSLVVGPSEVMTTTTIEDISESFSDEVSVSMDPSNPDTGLIIPHFKDSDGEAYRYLIVPVAPTTHQ